MRKASLSANLAPKQLCQSWEPLRLDSSSSSRFSPVLELSQMCILPLFSSNSAFPCSHSLYYCSPKPFRCTPQNDNDDRYFSVHHVPDTVLSALNVSVHLILIYNNRAVIDILYEPCFTDEVTDTKRLKFYFLTFQLP